MGKKAAKIPLKDPHAILNISKKKAGTKNIPSTSNVDDGAGPLTQADFSEFEETEEQRDIRIQEKKDEILAATARKKEEVRRKMQEELDKMKRKSECRKEQQAIIDTLGQIPKPSEPSKKIAVQPSDLPKLLSAVKAPSKSSKKL